MHPIREIHDVRRERVFLILAGLFLSSMTMLNILGITRFVQLGPLAVAVGVLPYPLTFLCTDLIGELYGRKRAAFVVWCGLIVNVFVLSFVWLGHQLPSVAPDRQPPWQTLALAESVPLANGMDSGTEPQLFTIVYACTAGSVLASMLAYLAAQFCDVYLFHFWKRLTNGKHLWLRNNGSTLGSQLVDSIVVVTIVFWRQLSGGELAAADFLVLMLSNYAFKAGAALVDTLPFYFLTGWLSRYLDIDPMTVRE